MCTDTYTPQTHVDVEVRGQICGVGTISTSSAPSPCFTASDLLSHPASPTPMLYLVGAFSIVLLLLLAVGPRTLRLTPTEHMFHI